MSKIQGAVVLSTMAILISGCLETTDSSNVKPQATYQLYNVDYDESGQVLTASAEFDVGGPFGTSLELSAPSAVTFDGQTLGHTDFLGARYFLTSNGTAFTESHSFTWIDQGGTSYTNSVSLTPVHIDSAPASFSKSGAYALTVSGPSISSGESLTATLVESVNDSQQIATFSGTMSGTNTLTLALGGSDALQSFVPGQATLTLKRSRQQSLQQATSDGGFIGESYTTAPVTVQITE